MAPKKRRESSAADDDVFALEEEHQPEPEKVALGDTNALKRALDDAVVQLVADAGHAIDYTYTDLKIGMGLLACVIAVAAYFYPKKGPESQWVLGAAVATYCLLSTLMSVVAAVWEKDAIAFTKAAPGGPPALVVSSKLPRFDDTYTLRVAARGAPAPAGGGDGGGACISKSVGAYFHEDGQLAGDVIRRDAQALLQQFLEAKSK